MVVWPVVRSSPLGGEVGMFEVLVVTVTVVWSGVASYLIATRW
jgi:uncharacterized membrane protein (DUF4010 family)